MTNEERAALERISQAAAACAASLRLREEIKTLRGQIKYKDGQIDALKYAVNELAKCAYWPDSPK